MPRFHGEIGFAILGETAPGVWRETIEKRFYYGELVRNTRRLQTTDQVNDDVTVSNEISIVADPYANEKFHAIRYAKFMGTAWKVMNVEVRYPRLILTLGGVYNEQ